MTNVLENIFVSPKGITFCPPDDGNDELVSIILVVDTCGLVYGASQKAILDLKNRADTEGIFMRFVFPQILFTEMQFYKDIRVQGETRVQRESERARNNSYAAFIRNSMNSSAVFTLQSKQMEEEFQTHTGKVCSTKDELFLQAGRQQLEFYPNAKLVVVTNDLIFRNFLAANEVNDLHMRQLCSRLQNPNLSVHEILFGKVEEEVLAWVDEGEADVVKFTLRKVGDIFQNLKMMIGYIRDVKLLQPDITQEMEAKIYIFDIAKRMAEVCLEHHKLKSMEIAQTQFNTIRERLKTWDETKRQLEELYGHLYNRLVGIWQMDNEDVKMLMKDLEDLQKEIARVLQEVDKRVAENMPPRKHLDIMNPPLLEPEEDPDPPYPPYNNLMEDSLGLLSAIHTKRI